GEIARGRGDAEQRNIEAAPDAALAATGVNVDRGIHRPSVRGADAMLRRVRIACYAPAYVARQPRVLAGCFGNAASHLLPVRRQGLERNRRRFDDRTVDLRDGGGVRLVGEPDSGWHLVRKARRPARPPSTSRT